MEQSSKILSEVIHYMKYARYLPKEYRRETWVESCTRVMNMHVKKYPQLKEEIEDVFKNFVFTNRVLPSMRTMQFGGEAIEKNPVRNFNCAYAPIDSWETFHEIMFLLLAGCGVGYSVQKYHISKLPEIRRPNRRVRRHLVTDSIEGWADAVKVLMKSYFFGTSTIEFDYSDIRPRGTLLKTSGGRAPGPQPLKDCIHNLQKILDATESGDRLTSLEVHDMICYIADAVLSGGIRRSSLIALFDIDDEEMLTCKFGKWWEINPQRARANNSVMVLRHKITKDKFDELWEKIKSSGSGEPGIYFSNNATEYGVNPCQPAWATVLTPTGIKTLGDVSTGDTVWSGKRWTKITEKWSTGVKPVFTYRTTAGFFTGTEDHRVVSSGIKTPVRSADAIDTAQGVCTESDALDPQDVLDGLVIGDGTVHHASNNLVLLTIGDNDESYHQDETISGLIHAHRTGIGPNYWEVATTIKHEDLPHTYNRHVPTVFKYAATTKKMRGFLRGLYSANGSVCGNRVTLKASSFQIVHDVQTMLSALGIRSYYTTNKAQDVEFNNGTYTCKQSYDLNISVHRRKFAQLIGFVQPYKNAKLQSLIDKIPESKNQKHTYEIIDITSHGKHEVFDITVEDEDHTYWTGGLLVSNCNEASLRAHQFCNLTTQNVDNVASQKELNDLSRAAAFVGTLQAGYTDFHYLREVWRENTEKDALLGVSMTGVASGAVLNYDLTEAANVVLKENARIAKIIGINKAARTTLMKPEGTGSLRLGTSSGIHDWHSPYFIRRITVMKNEPIYAYLKEAIPELIEDDFFKPQTQAKIKVPIKAPDSATFRTAPALDLLERVKKVYNEWVKPGHRKGDNTHNISCTVSVNPSAWTDVGNWMWENRDHYNGLSVIPEDLGTYVQAPFTECTKEEYEALLLYLKDVDLSMVVEHGDNTDHKDQPACSGTSCVIT